MSLQYERHVWPDRKIAPTYKQTEKGNADQCAATTTTTPTTQNKPTKVSGFYKEHLSHKSVPASSYLTYFDQNLS